MQPEQLLSALIEALENKNSQYGSLNISCRAVTKDSAMFLITKEEKVVWQTSVDLEMITHPDTKAYINSIPMPIKKTDKLIRKLKISELRTGMKGVEVRAEVIKIPSAKLVNTIWGIQALVSNIKIADETGSISLCLWNNQIDTVHVGDEVEITNCKVTKFAEEPQLRIGRKGTISIVNQQRPEEIVQPIIQNSAS